jgi:Fic family protein
VSAQLALTFADHRRLGAQLAKVRDATVGRGWLTLAAIEAATGAPQASVSARLRELRARGFLVETRRSAPDSGLYVYRVSR